MLEDETYSVLMVLVPYLFILIAYLVRLIREKPLYDVEDKKATQKDDIVV